MTGNGNLPPSTAQDVLNLVSQKYLQNIDPSTPEEFNGFLEYLSNARQLLFVNAKRRGSLIITVGCRSLQILDDLCRDYRTGRLNEMAQKYLVTKELLNELGLTEAELTTSISEEEYRSCRNQLSVYAGELYSLGFSVHLQETHCMHFQSLLGMELKAKGHFPF